MQMPSVFKRIKQWVNKTIQRRMIVWSVSFWVLSIIILALVFLLIGQNQMLTVARQRNVQLASTISRDVNAQLSDIAGNTRTFAQHLEALESDLVTQADALLGLRLSSTRYRAIYYFDMKETLLFHISDTIDNLISLRNPEEIVNRPPIAVRNEITNVYNSVKITGIYISDFFYTPLDYTPVLYIGMPVNFPTGEIRVVVFEVDLSDIWQRIEIATVGQTGFTYVVSREGTIITHPEPTYIGSQIPDEIEPVLEGYEGSTQFVDSFTGKEVVAAYSPVGGLLGWGIVVSQDREEIYANLMKSSYIIIVILLVLGLIGTISILLLIRRFTRPIRKLTETTQEIARTGNLTKTGMLQQMDEVGQLSQSFDQMIDKVKDAGGKLISSEERYRSLFEHANDAIFLMRDDTFIDCNRKTAEIFACRREDILKRKPYEFSPPQQPDGSDSKEKALEKINAALSGNPQFFEWKHCRQDGSPFDAEVGLTRIEIEGEPMLLAIVRDVTARKQSEEALKQSEEHYRTLFNSTNDAIFIHDFEGNFLDANSVACDRLGYSYSELKRMRVTDMNAPEFAVHVPERIVELRSKGQFVAETAHVTKNGKVIPTEISSRVIQYYGIPAILCTARDITERKKAQIDLQKAYDELEDRVEQRTADLSRANALLNQEIVQREETEEKLRQSEAKYRDLVESANSIILEFDLNGNITFFNRFAQEFFGYSEEEILGRNILGTIVPEIDSTGADLKIRMTELLKHPERYSNSENENIRRNGERVWIAWTNKEIYDAEGNPSNILSIGIDRTEQKKTSEILAKQEVENAATVERTRLARDLHDAVSQTLFSASIIAEVLPRIWDKNREEGKRRLEEIRQLTRGALAEMRTLLFELRPSALADAELGYLLHQLAESVTGRSRIPIEVDIKEERDLTPEVKIALYRITQEALNNVAKHANASYAKVSLTYKSGVLELSISDNGRGFDMSGVHPDSLGLGIMRERAREIGAEITVQSTIGSGSKITVKVTDKHREV